MRKPIQILVDKNNSNNKIVDMFGICEGNQNDKYGEQNRYISCIHKTNKFTWICNLDQNKSYDAVKWIENNADKNDDSVLIEMTHEESRYSIEKRKDLANDNIKKIGEILYVQQVSPPKQSQ